MIRISRTQSSTQLLLIATSLALGACGPQGVAGAPASPPQAEASPSAGPIADDASPVSVVEGLVDSLVKGWNTELAKKDQEHFTVRFIVEGRSASLVVSAEVTALKGKDAVSTPHDVEVKLSRELALRIARGEVTLKDAKPELTLDNPEGFDQVLKLRL